MPHQLATDRAHSRRALLRLFLLGLLGCRPLLGALQLLLQPLALGLQVGHAVLGLCRAACGEGLAHPHTRRGAPTSARFPRWTAASFCSSSARAKLVLNSCIAAGEQAGDEGGGEVAGARVLPQSW